jgi:hypothetical protein
LAELLEGNLFRKTEEVHHAHRLVVANFPTDGKTRKTIDDKMVAEHLLLLASSGSVERIVRPGDSLGCE